MKTKIVLSVIVISFCVTIAFGFIYKSAITRKNDNTEWVLHTYQVIVRISDLLSGLKDAETGQRGFILTNNYSYLEPYEASLSQIQKDIDALELLISDNEKQLKVLNSLKYSISSKLSELKYTISLRKEGKNFEALAIINSQKGKISMDSIRDLARLMINEEQYLLKVRNVSLNESNNQLEIVAYSFLFFIGFSLIVSYFLIVYIYNSNRILTNSLTFQNESLEQKVKDRTAELLEKNKELLKLNRDKNRFLGMAAHDLKSPLHNIKGLISLFDILIINRTDEVKEITMHINSAIDRMTRLISDLLNINKIESGKNIKVIEDCDLSMICDNIYLSFYESAKKKSIEIDFFNLKPGVAIVKSNKGYLIQIIENLVSNALKFTKSGKRISIVLEKAENDLLLYVKDEGIGIKKDELPLLFHEFSMLSSRPTGEESSTGLGMSIVKRLADELNISIEVTSEILKGTIFKLHIRDVID